MSTVEKYFTVEKNFEPSAENTKLLGANILFIQIFSVIF